MNDSYFSSPWRRWFARRPAAIRHQQRLTGFEPLEPRTVLSSFAWIAADEGRDFSLLRDDAYRDVPGNGAPGNREAALHADDARGYEPQRFVAGTVSFAPLLAPPPRDLGFVARGEGESSLRFSPPPAAMPSSGIPLSPLHSEDQSIARTPILTTFAPAGLRPVEVAVGAFRPAGGVATTPAGTVVVMSIPSSSAVSINSVSSGATLIFSNWNAAAGFLSVMPYTGGSLERVSESRPTNAASPYRESPGYSWARPLAGEAAAEMEAGIAKVFEPGIASRSSASLALAASSLGQADSAGQAAISTADDQPGGLSPANRSAAPADEESGDSTDAVELIRQKRKAAAEASVLSSGSPRLVRLADLPAIRDGLSLLGEWLRAADEAFAAGPANQPGHNFSLPDEGMIELLAADVGTLGTPAATTADRVAPLAASRAITLEASMGLYQAFDDGTSSGETPVAAPAAEVVASPVAAEQLARTE